MIGSFATRGITMFVGYIYPAYECFKVVEQRRPNLESLRSWCQYWIIIALVTVLERIADTFVSWIPMYQEAKLAFIIYLWYPRTRGTTYVYTSFLRPYVTSHESEIDQHLNELRTRALDCVAANWERGSAFIQSKFFEILQYVVAQGHRPAPPPPQPPPPAAPQPPPPPPAQGAPPPGNYPPGAPPGNYPPGPPPEAFFRSIYPPLPPPAGYEASAPPAPGVQPPPQPEHRPGFYPYPRVQPFQAIPQPPREQIVLEEEDEEEEIILRPNLDVTGAATGATAGAAAAGAAAVSSSAARYMTRSRQRASASGRARDWFFSIAI